MIDLDPRYLAMVRDILAKHAPHQTVWVHGSRVRGTAHAGSDLDLVVMDSGENPKPDLLDSLRTAFRESNLPVLADIMLWSEVPDAFRDNIAEMHEVVQCASESL